MISDDWDTDRWDGSWEDEPPLATAPAARIPGVLVAIVEPEPAARARLVGQFGDPVLAVGAVAELRSHVTSLQGDLVGAPIVVVLGPSCGEPATLEEMELLLRSHPEAAAILLSPHLTPGVFRQALRAGIKDVLPSPTEVEVLVESVSRVSAEIVFGTPGATVAGFPVDPVHPDLPSEQGRLLTVFSTKGGAGKSVLAVNMAVSLARRSTRPVVLVDADLQFGDVAVMTKLAPQHTILDAVDNIDRLDAALLQSLLVRHEPSGVYVLPAPLEPQFADRISAHDVLKVVEVLRSFAAHVIVDTPASFTDVVLALIEASDDVLLVAGMDVPNIKNVKIGLQTLRLLDTPASKLHLILNRANAKVKLDVGEVERTLQLPAVGQIPSDVVVPASVNKGLPVVLDAPRSPVTKAIEAIVDLFVPNEAAVPAGRRRGRR